MYDPLVETAFYRELLKLAFSPATAARLRSIGAMGGVGALAGAGVGAGAQGVRGYRQAREEGAGVGGALAHGASTASAGAVTGGALGALGGAVLGGVRPGAGNAVADRFTGKDGVVGAFTRAGQRQVHGVTGWTPEGGVDSLRGGAYDAVKAEQHAKGLADAAREAPKTRMSELRRKLWDDPELNHRRAVEATAAAREATDAGLTGLPGTVRAFRRAPVDTLKKSLGLQWRGAGPAAKGLAALGAAGAVGDVYGAANNPDDPNRGARMGGGVAGLVGTAALAPVLPMGAALAAGTALSAGGHALGSVYDRSRARRASLHPEESVAAGPPPLVESAPRAAGGLP